MTRAYEEALRNLRRRLEVLEGALGDLKAAITSVDAALTREAPRGIPGCVEACIQGYPEEMCAGGCSRCVAEGLYYGNR